MKEGINMKNVILMITKIIITVSLALSALLLLTDWRLNGIHIFGWNVSAEQVNMVVDSAGSYLYLAFVTIVILIIWGVWIGRKVVAKKSDS